MSRMEQNLLECKTSKTMVLQTSSRGVSQKNSKLCTSKLEKIRKSFNLLIKPLQTFKMGQKSNTALQWHGEKKEKCYKTVLRQPCSGMLKKVKKSEKSKASTPQKLKQ